MFAVFIVMPAGFFLSMAALVLFPAAGPRTAFILCALAVEIVGLIVAVRGHMENRQPDAGDVR